MYTTDAVVVEPITVYTKPNCPQCTMTKRKLNQLDAYWQERTIDEQVLSFARAEGISSAPIVQYQDKSWGGFRPEDLLTAANEQRETFHQNLLEHSHHVGDIGSTDYEANGLQPAKDGYEFSRVMDISVETENEEGKEIVVCLGGWMYATGLSRCADVLYHSLDHDEPLIIDLMKYAPQPGQLLTVKVLGMNIPLNLVFDPA